MSTPLTLAAAVAAACVSSFVLVKALAPPEPLAPAAVPADLEARLAALAATTERLATRIEQMSAASPEVRAEPRVAVPTVSDEQVQRALESLLAAKGKAALSPLADAAARKAESAGPPFDLDGALAELASGRLGWEDRDELWKRAREAGKLEDLVTAFEEFAGKNPGVADAQVQLGQAYLQRLSVVPDGPEKGTWAIKADKAFDAALEIDDHHWEARFAKAMSLSFWPPVFGKGAEAVQHFETLVAQQEGSGVVRPHQAQVYTLLGNLYEQQGKRDEARKVWSRGALRHPESSDLKERLSR